MKIVTFTTRKEFKDFRAQQIANIAAAHISEHHKTYGSSSTAWYASEEYRYYHIAYCMLRGRTYEEIEQNVHKEKTIPEGYVSSYSGEHHGWAAINKIVEVNKELFKYEEPNVCIAESGTEQNLGV